MKDLSDGKNSEIVWAALPTDKDKNKNKISLGK